MDDSSNSQKSFPDDRLWVKDEWHTVMGLTPIFKLFSEGKKPCTPAVGRELLILVRSFNAIPDTDEDAWLAALVEAYGRFLSARVN
ncbi:MAG: hypothetical protein ABFD44_02455 [Anaerolineaceae bacterium]